MLCFGWFSKTIGIDNLMTGFVQDYEGHFYAKTKNSAETRELQKDTITHSPYYKRNIRASGNWFNFLWQGCSRMRLLLHEMWELIRKLHIIIFGIFLIDAVWMVKLGHVSKFGFLFCSCNEICFKITFWVLDYKRIWYSIVTQCNVT